MMVGLGWALQRIKYVLCVSLYLPADPIIYSADRDQYTPRQPQRFAIHADRPTPSRKIQGA